MRDSANADDKVREPSDLARQAEDIEPWDIKFPYEGCFHVGLSLDHRSTVIALSAIHEQLIVNAALLRKLIVQQEESGTRASLGWNPHDTGR